MGRWATYTFMGRQLSSGAAENHEYDVSPGVGNEMELMWGYIQPESSAVNCFVTLQDALDSGDVLGSYMGFNSVGAGVRAVFPDRFAYSAAAQQQIGYGGTPEFLSGDVFLHAGANAVPDGERSRCVVHARIRGDKPTAAMSGGSGTSELIRDQVY
ncbi:MAG: hypothetical protein V3U33_00325 [candidate division NC10 bacterium]